MEELSLNDIFIILKLRRKVFFGVVFIMLILSMVFALSWSRYYSEATIQVSQPQVVSTTDSSKTPDDLADLRINYVQQKVLSISSLIDIINKFNLYPAMRDKMPITKIAEKMFKKITVQLKSADLANPVSAQKASADQLEALAFTIGFKYSDPSLAQQVTNELVSRFLDEDIKQRQEQAKETSAFLEAQINVLDKSLKEQGQKIAEIQSQNGALRPDALAFNQQATATTLMSLQNIETQIATSLGNIGALKGQLAATDPYSRLVGDGQVLTTPSAQLRALRTQYAILSAQYGPKHPDVVKTRHQLEAMEKQIGMGSSSEVATLKALISDVETKLAQAQKAYGPENPDVQSLSNQLSRLNDQLKAEIEKTPNTSLIQKDADNPLYLQLVAQLDAAEKQYQAFLAQKAQIQNQLSKYQKAITQNPAIEQQLADLMRNYQNDSAHYNDLKQRKMQADIASTIQKESVGKKFVVLDPAEMPIGTSPSRLILIAAGLFLSIFSGFVAAFGLQLATQSVVSSSHIEQLMGVAPLVVVSRLKTPNEKVPLWRRHGKKILIFLTLIAVLLAFISIFVMPLDELVSYVVDLLL